MFANTACACAGAAANIAESDPHAHHQMQGGDVGLDSALCPHQECEDCESLSVASFSDRDANLASFVNFGPDDVLWTESNEPDTNQPRFLMARAGPLSPTLFRRAETPVRRADLLLE